MDESVISGPSSSSGGASQATSSGSQGRFPSFNGPDLNARNILDESLDIEASGAATGDGLVDDDQEDISFTKQSYSNEGRRDGQPSSASSSRANAARMGSALNAPVAELAALAIQEGPGRSGSQLDTAPNSNVAADSGIKKEAAAIAIDRDDALPIEPPLSAEERRQHSLKRERDDLAKMNTLLEQAIASIERTVPKFEVCPLCLVVIQGLAAMSRKEPACTLTDPAYIPIRELQFHHFIFSQRFQDTMKTSHKLLDTYTRILSQADHTQQLLLDGNWEVQRVSLRD